MSSIGLAIILKNELPLIDSFIKNNNVFKLFKEVKFLDDFSTDGGYKHLQQFDNNTLIKVYQRDLKFNFAAQRNYLNSKMKSEYICRIDMDEFMSLKLQQYIKTFKGTLDYYTIDRYEIVNRKFMRITPQPFIYKNTRPIHWVRHIHECVVGHKSQHHLDKDLFLVHAKSNERCIRQHCFYWDNWKEHRDMCKQLDAKKRSKNGL